MKPSHLTTSKPGCTYLLGRSAWSTVAHAAGREQYTLQDLAHVSLVGPVLFIYPAQPLVTAAIRSTVGYLDRDISYACYFPRQARFVVVSSLEREHIGLFLPSDPAC